MALAPLKLPKLQARVPIVDNKGQPTGSFVRYWNIDFIGAIEGQINGLAEVQAELAALNETQQEEIERLDAAVAAISSLLGIVTTSNAQQQAITEAANNAQATADDALAAGTVSGSATDPAVDVLAGDGWISGPTVNLTGVVAGNLYITGTGPIQDSDVTVVGIGSGLRTMDGEFRVVEIDGATEDVVFTGDFSAYQSGATAPATISNDSATAVSSFVAARTTTGAISYRLDFQSALTSVSDLRGYIFARREP